MRQLFYHASISCRLEQFFGHFYISDAAADALLGHRRDARRARRRLDDGRHARAVLEHDRDDDESGASFFRADKKRVLRLARRVGGLLPRHERGEKLARRGRSGDVRLRAGHHFNRHRRRRFRRGLQRAGVLRHGNDGTAGETQGADRRAPAGDRLRERARNHAESEFFRFRRRNLHHHGRERLREIFAAALPHRAAAPALGRGSSLREKAERRRAAGTRRAAAAHRRDVSGRRAVVVDDAARKRVAPARGIHDAERAGARGSRPLQAGAGRPFRRGGKVSFGDFRRHGETRLDRARHRARSRNSVFRRARRGAGPDRVEGARRPHAEHPRVARHDDRHRHA